MTATPSILTQSNAYSHQRLQLLVDTLDSAAWKDCLQPALQAKIEALSHQVLHDNRLSLQEREGVRQQYLALHQFVEGLKTEQASHAARLQQVGELSADFAHLVPPVEKTATGAVQPGPLAELTGVDLFHQNPDAPSVPAMWRELFSMLPPAVDKSVPPS
jgi:hypothetical protein